MNNKGFSMVQVMIAAGLVIIIGGGVLLYFNKTDTQEPVACTAEAMLCPDGSSVGRQGPDCKFAECPRVTVVDEEEEVFKPFNPSSTWVSSQENRYPITFFHPDSFSSILGGDKGTESNAFIGEEDGSGGYILITDYVEIDVTKGNIGNPYYVTSDEKIELLREELLENSEELDSEILKNFEKEAFVFKTSEGFEESEKTYLINTGEDVVSVTFYNYDLFNSEFIYEFLNRLEPNI